MPELIIRTDDEAEAGEQRIALEAKDVVIGRGEAADVFIAEKRASRRHVRLRRVEGGGWVAEELGSANGTFLGEQRILRRLLEDGDVLRIGATTLTYAATGGASPRTESRPEDEPAVVIGGTLQVHAVTDTSAEAIPTHVEVPSEPAPRVSPAGDEEGRRRAPARSTSGKGLVFVVVAVAILIGEHFLVGGQADKARAQTTAQKEFLEVLDHLGDPYPEFAAEVADFEERFPSSPLADSLQEHLTFARERDEHRRLVDEQLAQVVSWADKLEPSEVRSRLMELQRKLPQDEAFITEIRRHIASLDRRREALDQEQIDRLGHQVALALEAARPARAMRLITAFRGSSPGMSPGTVERLTPLEERAQREMQRVFDEAWKQADEAKTPQAVRAALKDAWSSLAGTELGARIENRIRDSARASGEMEQRPDRPDPSGAPGQPTAPTPDQPLHPGVGDDVLAMADRAQTLILGRSWGLGKRLLEQALAKVDRGRLKNEWTRLLADTDRVLGLVDDLAADATSEKPPKVKLSVGRVTVTAADAGTVTWTTAAGETVKTEWSDVEDEDVLPLLIPAKPTPEQRLGGAVLAADLSQKELMNKLLVPLFEKQKLVDEASNLIAWRVYGRAAPPDGGYQVYKGQIVDQKGLERMQEQELIAAHRQRAGMLLAQLAKQKVFKKLEKLKALRTELDKRRKYALLAIFNEKHYPYPANKSGKPYQAVQKEIDERIDAVRAIWDDPYKVKIGRKGNVGKALGEYEQIVAKLEQLGEDVRSLKQDIAPYAMYVTEEPITVREFYLDAKEKTRFAYSRWVMALYNPARLEYATAVERKQTRVTNDYRIMMGYSAQVRPGNAAFESIDGDSVVQVLDSGEVLRMSPLRAVRVDNRLVQAARLHSLDMQKRGYFSHFSKPNPATGQGQTSPHERMRTQGYQGYGSSENIANGASQPEQAHWMWRHSSGHHRNLISPWIDMGCGHAGRMWTQNFGMGGGARAAVHGDTDIQTPLRGGMPASGR